MKVDSFTGPVTLFVRRCSFSYSKAFSVNSSKTLPFGHDAIFSWLLSRVFSLLLDVLGHITKTVSSEVCVFCTTESRFQKLALSYGTGSLCGPRPQWETAICTMA